MDQTKLAPYDLGPTDSVADGSPISAEPSVQPGSADDKAVSAVEAVRYLFLAKELRRLGQSQAADRWQAKATAWLQRLSSGESEPH